MTENLKNEKRRPGRSAPGQVNVIKLRNSVPSAIVKFAEGTLIFLEVYSKKEKALGEMGKPVGKL